MRLSLRSRLLLATGLAVTAALGALVWLSSRITERRFETFLLEQRQADSAAPAALPVEELARFYLEHGSWEGVGAWLAARAENAGAGILLFDAEHRFLAASRPEISTAEAVAKAGGSFELRLRAGPPPGEARLLLAFDQDPGRAVRAAGGEIVGWVYPLPPPPDKRPAAHFLNSVRRGLLGAVAALALSTLGLAAWFIHRALGPVRALTAATKRVARGELGARVEATADDEVGELARAFNSMAARLEEGRQLRRRLTSDVAHELRTPLTSLSCQIEALQAGLTPADGTALGSLAEEVAALTRLINDLQDLALAEAGELRLAPRPADLGAEVQAVVRSYAHRRGPRFEVALVELPRVMVDPERLRQVLKNLLDNALAHTPPEGTITIHGREEGSEVELSVSDTGAGIEPEHLPFVFERLWRADASRSRERGGAGLGLAIVKQLVEAQGGRVGVESEPGRGSRFWVRLPRLS